MSGSCNVWGENKTIINPPCVIINDDAPCKYYNVPNDGLPFHEWQIWRDRITVAIFGYHPMISRIVVRLQLLHSTCSLCSLVCNRLKDFEKKFTHFDILVQRTKQSYSLYSVLYPAFVPSFCRFWTSKSANDDNKWWRYNNITTEYTINNIILWYYQRRHT